MKKTFSFLFLSSLTFIAFSQGNNADAEKIIRQNVADFSKHVMAGDHVAIAAAYTDDAKIFPNGMDILRGNEAIHDYWTPQPEQTSKNVYHHVMPEEIKIMGNEAYDWGYYEGKTRRGDGTEVAWKGKYVIVWKEVNPGDWKIYLDIWNGMPLEEPIKK